MFYLDNIKEILSNSLKKLVFLAFDLNDKYGEEYFNPNEFINITKNIYDKDSTAPSNVIYLDEKYIINRRDGILLNRIYKWLRENRYPHPHNLLRYHFMGNFFLNRDSIINHTLTNDILEKLLKWFKELDNRKFVSELVFEFIEERREFDKIAQIIMLFILLTIRNPKIIIIENPKNLDLPSLILIEKLLEVKEFFNSKNINIGISLIYLNKHIIPSFAQQKAAFPRQSMMMYSNNNQDNSSEVQKQLEKYGKSFVLYDVYYGTNRKKRIRNI